MISIVLITLNEEENLQRSLPLLKQISSDIVVVDAMSTDRTIEVCRSYGIHVTQRAWEGYASTKNFGASLARNNWILSLDADEVLSDRLLSTLKELRPEEGTLYALDRLTNFCGSWIWHSGWYPDWKIRLYNRNKCHWVGDFVHEELSIPPKATIVKLEGKLYHYSYTSHQDHLERTERYAELSAKELVEKGKQPQWFQSLLSLSFRFIRTYILKRGFLDGKEGWTISKRNAHLVRLRYKKMQELLEQPTSGIR